jgi:hypothetical protein
MVALRKAKVCERLGPERPISGHEKADSRQQSRRSLSFETRCNRAARGVLKIEPEHSEASRHAADRPAAAAPHALLRKKAASRACAPRAP